MKNNFVAKFSFFLLFFINSLNVNSDELKFEASSIEIIDKDKIVIAKDGVKIFSDNEIVIDADQMKYDKEKKFLNASGNIVITNQIKNTKILWLNYFSFIQTKLIIDTILIIKSGIQMETTTGTCSFFPSSSKKKLK